MNTEDRVMAVLARANPMPEEDSLDLSTDGVTYLATLEQRSREMTQLDTRPVEARKSTRSRLVAVAAAVVVVIGTALVLLTQNQEPPVATEPPPTTLGTPTTIPEASEELSPQLQDALAVATAFTQARADRDIQSMNDNAIEGHINGLIVGSLGAMPDELAWQEAVGWSMEVEGCEGSHHEVGGSTVRCDVSHSNSISEALGEGPHEGAYFMKVLHAGDEKGLTPINETTVTESLQISFPVLEFTISTWRPFVAWLETNHPEDVSLMFASEVQSGDVELMLAAGEREPSLSEESIALWSQYTTEFVAEMDQG